MKFFVTLVWLGLASFVLGEGKFAIVRVTDIYRGLPSTAAMQEQVKERRAAIIENERAENLRRIIGEMQAIETQLQDIRDSADTDLGKKVIRDYEIKRQEAETLRKEFEEFRRDQEKEINGQLVSEMRKSLERISEAVAQIAKERNLHGIFDTSGDSNTGVPFVLYSGDAEDITEDVMEILNQEDLKAAAAASEEESGEEGTPETPEEPKE